MMAKKNTLPQRIPPSFFGDMNNILNLRIQKGLLNRKEATFPKAVKLLTKTQGYQVSLKELQIKPEKLKPVKKDLI